MKGKGPRIERETSIVFNEVKGDASIWTASEPMYRKLKKLGFHPVEDRDRSATFQMPKKCVSFRRVGKPRVLSEKHKAALIAGRNARFSSGAFNAVKDLAPNPSTKG